MHGTSSTTSNSNPAPTTSLPIASTELSEVIAITNNLLESVNRGSLKDVREAAQSLFSSGQVLAAEAYILNKHSCPLDITGKLIEALDSTNLALEHDLRYLVARILRLFAELVLIRRLKTDEPIPSEWKQKYAVTLSHLVARSKEHGRPGLKFELQCAAEAIKRWAEIKFKERYGERLVEFFVDSAEGALQGGVGGIKNGVQLIKDLRKEKAASWYHEVLILGVEGSRCATNLERFRAIQQEIKVAYDRAKSKTDRKLLFCAADVLGDLTWRSTIPEIREGALNGSKGSAPDGSDAVPGLTDLARLQTTSKDRSLNLWRVRYHACCHLSALRKHPYPDVTKRAGEALNNRHTLEGHEKAQPLLDKLVKEPACTAYQSFFYTPNPKVYSVDEGAELKRQEANLLCRERELELKRDTLQERENALTQATIEFQAQKDQLADVQGEKAKVAVEKRENSSLLAQIQTEKQDLSKVRSALEQGQQEFLQQVEAERDALRKAQQEHVAVECDQKLKERELASKEAALKEQQTEQQNREAQLADVQDERAKLQEEQKLQQMLAQERQRQAKDLESLYRAVQESQKRHQQETRADVMQLLGAATDRLQRARREQEVREQALDTREETLRRQEIDSKERDAEIADMQEERRKLQDERERGQEICNEQQRQISRLEELCNAIDKICQGGSPRIDETLANPSKTLLHQGRSPKPAHHVDKLHGLDDCSGFGEHVLKLLRQATGSQARPFADMFNRWGCDEDSRGKKERAKGLYQQAEQMALKACEPHDSLLMYIWMNLGTVLRELEDENLALKYHEQALEIARARYTKDHPKAKVVASALSKAATTRGALKDYQKAVEYYQEAYEIVRDSSEMKEQDLDAVRYKKNLDHYQRKLLRK